MKEWQRVPVSPQNRAQNKALEAWLIDRMVTFATCIRRSMFRGRVVGFLMVFNFCGVFIGGAIILHFIFFEYLII